MSHGSKRQKLTNGESKVTGGSRFFAPYRIVGLVSPTSVPFTSVPLGKETFQITTSIGRSLQTYDLRRGLNLVFISRPQTPGPISATQAWRDKVLGAWSSGDEHGVWVFKRGKKEAELELPDGWHEDIQAICCFGAWIVGVGERSLLVWKASFKLHAALRGVSPIPFTKCIISLPTFLNKILVGRNDGSVEIWNVSSGRLIYTIMPPSADYGAVTALENVPVLAVVAVAYQSGPILIHNVRSDETLIELSVAKDVPVSSISFRSDGLGAGSNGQEAGVMATASSDSGDITLWDLNDGGRKSGVLRSAHGSPGVSNIEFLSGQPLLVSSGMDNSLRTWIFDNSPFSPIPRLLHQRAGHGATITNLEFLPSASDGSDDVGKWLMSASLDRSLWAWSLRRDGQSTEISQGAIQSKAKKKGLLSGNVSENLKCPPIVSIACSLNRDGGMGSLPGKHPIWSNPKSKNAETAAMTGWESIITAHLNDNKARTWFWGRKKAGRWAFTTSDGSPVSSVAITSCGTFAIVGSFKGSIDTYNLQSGQHRQRFPPKRLKKGDPLPNDEGDNSPIVGLAVSSGNQTLISASANGTLKFWSFITGQLQHTLTLPPIAHLHFHKISNLCALACRDTSIRVVDVSTHRLIRELHPSRPVIPTLLNKPINSVKFSSTGRWVAATISTAILIWDLPTGNLVDCLPLKGGCTSLAFSPTDEYLAAATQSSVGIEIWSNKSLFSTVASRSITAGELDVLLSSDPQSVRGEAALISATDEAEHGLDLQGDGISLPEPSLPEPPKGLLRLSNVPASQWRNLLYIDLIRRRNRPIAPPEKPKSAPFFLPSLAVKGEEREGREGKEEIPTEEALAKEESRVIKLGREDGFKKLLHEYHQSGPEVEGAVKEDSLPAKIIAHLKRSTPSAAEVSIRLLDGEGEILPFLRALSWGLQERDEFEVVQVWMAVFLRVHGDFVTSSGRARELLGEWRDNVDGEVAGKVRFCRGVVGFIGGWG
ncbi:putative U3 snoRNP protein [Piedraia hortae CBS 480.64]|uniref:Putative U3 snoRNP protein n=1 Tax=Piedraia hortae CBS 480.64 TaxID=1314780 RepID=A0A6A7BYK5_9PEZI|nr:putative U3 snoRNP protein [Piedraia hortae CBS 480.64]